MAKFDYNMIAIGAGSGGLVSYEVDFAQTMELEFYFIYRNMQKGIGLIL